jgi:hypothetical protein
MEIWIEIILIALPLWFIADILNEILKEFKNK